MATLEELVVEIDADTGGLKKGFKTAQDGAKNVGTSIKKLGGIIAGAFAGKAILDFGKDLIQAGSDAEEVQNKFDVVFGELAGDAEDFAESFSNSVGRSRAETKRLLADSQDLLTGFGATTDEAFKFSKQITELGTDLASFNNLQDTDAIDRLRKGLLGETENLKSLGIVVNQTVLEQEALNSGYEDGLKGLTELEKIQLRYQIAVRQSGNAIGDAERSQDSFASQLKRLQTSLADARAELGAKLLPVATKFITFLNNALPTFNKFKSTVAETVKNALIPFKAAVGEIFEAIKFATSISNDFTVVLGLIGQSLQNSENAVLQFVGEGLEMLGKKLFEIISIVKELSQQFIDILVPIFEQFVTFVQDSFPIVQEILTQVFQEGQKRAQVLVDFFRSTLLPAFQAIVQFALERLPLWRDIFLRVFGIVFDISKVLWQFFVDNLLPIIKLLVEFVVKNMPIFEETIRTVFEVVLAVIEPVWQFIKDKLLPIFAAIFTFIQDNWPVFQEIFERTFAVIKRVVDIAVGIFQDLFAIFNAIWEFVEPVFSTIGDILKVAFDIIIEVVKVAFDLFNDFLNVVEDIWDFVNNVFAGIGKVIEGAFNIVKDAVNGVIGVFEVLRDLVTNTVEKIADAINFAREAASAIAGVFGGDEPEGGNPPPPPSPTGGGGSFGFGPGGVLGATNNKNIEVQFNNQFGPGTDSASVAEQQRSNLQQLELILLEG